MLPAMKPQVAGSVYVALISLCILAIATHFLFKGKEATLGAESRAIFSGVFRSGTGAGDSRSASAARWLSSQVSINMAKPDLNFTLASSELDELLSLLYNRYELGSSVGGQFMHTANNIAENTWDILKYKFAGKILTPNSTFLMIFGGSSVTAGHDNYYNQSFPYIFKKRMYPIFKALGIELIVHNIAQGANNCIPYTMCYESMGSPNPDFVGWEQSYNCGHADDIFEMIGRLAAQSKNFGVAYFSASGAWAPSKCAKSTDPVPYCDEEWSYKNAGLPKFSPTKTQLQVIKAKFGEYNRNKPSAARFTQAWEKSGDYRGAGAHGFNVWESNPLCRTIGKDGKEQVNCNGIDASQSQEGNCKMKFMTQEASIYGSDNGKGANWHPTRAFHMLRGEFIAYLYSLIMLDAIYMVEADLKSSDASVDTLSVKYLSKLREIHPHAPSLGKKCSAYHCERRAVCYTNYLPHYGEGLRLTDIMVGKTNWTHDPEPYTNYYNEWSLHYGYLDGKPLFTAKPENGDIQFKVNIASSSADYFMLCGASKESLLHAIVHIDLNIGQDQLATYSPTAKRVEWSKRKVIGNECEYIYDVPKGQHVVTLTPSPTHPQHTTSLTHVITYE